MLSENEQDTKCYEDHDSSHVTGIIYIKTSPGVYILLSENKIWKERSPNMKPYYFVEL